MMNLRMVYLFGEQAPFIIFYKAIKSLIKIKKDNYKEKNQGRKNKKSSHLKYRNS